MSYHEIVEYKYIYMCMYVHGRTCVYIFILYKIWIKHSYNNNNCFMKKQTASKNITVENRNAQSTTRFMRGSECVCFSTSCWSVIWESEVCLTGKKKHTKTNRYHAEDCSVIVGPHDSPFPGNASHRLEWLHVFQGKTRLALSESLKIEVASNVARVCARILPG